MSSQRSEDGVLMKRVVITDFCSTEKNAILQNCVHLLTSLGKLVHKQLGMKMYLDLEMY